MAAVVRIKNNRFARINLQNKNAKYYSFKDITQPGVLHGYIKGVVKTAYPLFPQNYYGKLRKMILEETKDDEDDDGERLEFPIFTCGTVAEGCAEVKEGDYLLLENPYFELSHPDRPDLQISGYKKCSDICIWNISNKSTLLVGPEEDGCAADDIAKYQEDNDDDLDDSDVDSSQDQSSSLHVKDDDTKLAKLDQTALKTDASGSTDTAKSVRVTRSSTLKKDGQLQRVTRSSSSSKENDGKVGTTNTFPRRKCASPEESSQESQDSSASQSERRLTRSSLKKATDGKNARITRSTSSKHNVRVKESSQESKDSSASQSEGRPTRSASSKTMDSSDTFPSPPRKRKRKFRLGPKGTSDSPGDSPDLRNVVALEVKIVKTHVQEHTPQPEASNTKVGEKTSPVNSTDEIGGSSRASPCPGQHKAPSSSKPPKGADSSQENEDKEEGEQMTNSQASTPSGTFSSKKQKCFGQRESSPASPRKDLGPTSQNNVNNTPTKTNKIQPSVMVGSPGKVKNNTRNNSTEPNTEKYAVVTFVDDNQVPEKRSNPSTEQGKGAKGVVDESEMGVKEATVAQPSVSGVTTSSTISSTDPTISTSSSNVPSTGTTSTAATSTTSTGNVPPQSSSYTVPAPYTKICDVKLNTMCDLYGVAKFFKPPWRSRGTDMCSVVVIADPSTDEPLECVMFKDVILLPQIRRVGDIVRLHRMNIKMYKDKLQAVSTRGFSALVFDGNVNSPVTKESARVNTRSFTFVDAEKKIVQDLKEWRLSRPDLFEEAKFLTVSMVEPDVYFDILCQVKGISRHANVDCVVLRVTDGTKPKYEIKSCEDDDFYQVVIAADSQSQFPVFDVFLYGEHASLVNTLGVKAGTVLLLHNVHSIATQGGPGASLLDVLEPTLELCIHRGSEYGRGLAALSLESNEAVQLIQRLKSLGETSPRKQS